MAEAQRCTGPVEGYAAVGLMYYVAQEVALREGLSGSVERTCAVVDIPPRVLHLPVGVELVVGEYVVERNLVAELRALQV